MAVELMAEQDGAVFLPVVVGSVQWETWMSGSPGRLTFTVLEEEGFPALREGCRVSLRLDGTLLFCGYVFTRVQEGRRFVSVTAYDQLRYLLSRDTLLYVGMTASGLLRMIAADYRLALGEVEETGYVIAQGAEENAVLWDMIENALDETARATGRRYVLFDDGGLLCLKHVDSLRTNVLLDESCALSFTCRESIDTGAYSRVKLLYEDGRRGIRRVFTASDESLADRWGVLQYFEKLQDPAGAQEKAGQLLRTYGRPLMEVTVKGAVGSPQVRAGSQVTLDLPRASGLFLVESACHTFFGGAHTMDLTMTEGG